MKKYFAKRIFLTGGLPAFLKQFFLSSMMSLGFFMLSVVIFSSCNEKKQSTEVAVKKDVYYTCSMHPQIHEDHPGNCPICGMKLIAVTNKSMSTGMDADKTMQVHLSDEQIVLGNIQADTVGKSNIGDKLVLTGTINFNQDKLSSVNARVEGRIDKLYFKNIGDYVRKGDKLYDLYSEQLNNAKQEYLTALEQQNTVGNSLINYGALVESSKTKLQLWGMTNAQLIQLSKSKQVSTHTSFYSTESGYITALNTQEGDYVMEGGIVVQLANLSTLWAEAQVYSTQMSFINKNGNVTVQIPDLNKTINGTIDFVNPEMDPGSRINLVRVTIPNKNNELHPGMPVYMTIKNKQRNAMTLPSSAVLRDSKGATVWIQTAPGIYEIRMVKTGLTENNAIEITSGINAGDVVVTSGAYLLNSEFVFQHGSDPMAGMKM